MYNVHMADIYILYIFCLKIYIFFFLAYLCRELCVVITDPFITFALKINHQLGEAQPGLVYTECLKVYRKSVLHLLISIPQINT